MRNSFCDRNDGGRRNVFFCILGCVLKKRPFFRTQNRRFGATFSGQLSGFFSTFRSAHWNFLDTREKIRRRRKHLDTLIHCSFSLFLFVAPLSVGRRVEVCTNKAVESGMGDQNNCRYLRLERRARERAKKAPGNGSRKRAF